MVSLVKSSAISLSSLADSRAGDAAMLTGGLSAGLAVMVGILVTGESSGAHMNPAVSVGMAIWGRVPLTSLPAYLTGQFLGSFSAAALLLLSWSSAVAQAGPAVMASSPVLGSSLVELVLDQAEFSTGEVEDRLEEFLTAALLRHEEPARTGHFLPHAGSLGHNRADVATS